MLSRVIIKNSHISKSISLRFFSQATSFNADVFATEAHVIATEAANAPYESQIGTPIYRHPGPINKAMPKYTAQAKRISKITKDAQIEVQQAKADFQELVKVVELAGPVTSTSANPLSLEDNTHLKFRVLTALMKHSGMVIPSSALGEIKNVNDVVAFYKNRLVEIEASKSRTQYENLPSNVKVVTNKKIIAKHGY